MWFCRPGHHRVLIPPQRPVSKSPGRLLQSVGSTTRWLRSTTCRLIALDQCGHCNADRWVPALVGLVFFRIHPLCVRHLGARPARSSKVKVNT